MWQDIEWRLAVKKLKEYRENVLVRLKLSETSYYQGPRYYNEDLFLRKRDINRNESPQVSEIVTESNCAPIGQVCNDIYCTNIQDITVSMETFFSDGTQYQYVTSPIG